METKIGRNDPCPCGSGKKYKLCCLGRPLPRNDAPTLSPRFRFEPGSYSAPGTFLPSLACLEQWKPHEWRYHFVLVRPDVICTEESEAVSQAEADLNEAFENGDSLAGERIAECLKTLGYIRVEGFKILASEASPVA
jgi:hypothetical protein